MADIALTTRATTDARLDVVESIQQLTAPAAEALAVGDAVRFDTANGKFTKANATVAGEARVWGIATKAVAANAPVTVVRRGYLDGFDFSQAYDAEIHLSNTDGRLADAAGTVGVRIGRVVPAFATTLGTAADKILSVEL